MFIIKHCCLVAVVHAKTYSFRLSPVVIVISQVYSQRVPEIC